MVLRDVESALMEYLLLERAPIVFDQVVVLGNVGEEFVELGVSLVGRDGESGDLRWDDIVS